MLAARGGPWMILILCRVIDETLLRMESADQDPSIRQNTTGCIAHVFPAQWVNLRPTVLNRIVDLAFIRVVAIAAIFAATKKESAILEYTRRIVAPPKTHLPLEG